MTTPVPRRGGRSALVVNVVIAVAIVVLVAAVALVVKPPAPPGISEFAPQASKPITKAPQAQQADFGKGGNSHGQCTVGKNCPKHSTPPTAKSTAPHASKTPTVAKSTAPKGVPSGLQCFSWPDGKITQTFDPQSPSCVASWPGAAKGNGGSTSPGVTSSTITIAADAYYGAESKVEDSAIATFFNQHFELYGRKFQVVYPTVSGDEDSPDGQQADASTFAAYKPFAATSLVTAPDGQSVYADTLAAHHVISTVEIPGSETSSELTSHAPYEWSYAPTADLTERNLAAMICRSLPASKPAQYAGAGTEGKPRKFAILLPDSATIQDNTPPETSDLTNALSACGVTAKSFTYDLSGNAASNVTPATQFMLQLKQGGYTSLIYFGYPTSAGDYLMPAANTIGYNPEWISTGIGDQGAEDADGEWDQESGAQTSHLIGIAPWSKYLPEADEPWFEALSAETSAGATGNDSSNVATFYRQLLMIASGVQAAGPDLTPATFDSALTKLQFPNPGAAEAPFYQSTVGFGSGDHVMSDDDAAWWYSAGTVSENPGSTSETGTGATCDVEQGRRWTLTSWAPLTFFDKSEGCY